MAESSADEDSSSRKLKDDREDFYCGVVEGFYGRPWTPEQRRDLFIKMKKFGLNTYMYAPKDDFKHRAYWRELYSVEEADHLTALVQSAQENGIVFFYALSPGLDISYSNPKEIAALKRKLEQVSQFGCTAFALLFDDIEPEISEADKEVYQSFAHAQVAVANEIYEHLYHPKFMFCPTEYCAARAIPNVRNSEYLNTIGQKLHLNIDIMWTGPKVISKEITVESVQELTEVLHRPPLIWDNLHANDYDQKRLFMGPYCGRSIELIPQLRGVLTNPNCEYESNFIPIHTLSQWSKSTVDIKREFNISDSVSADIKLETETDSGCIEDIPSQLSPNTYHPKLALKAAIKDWLPEFYKAKNAFGRTINAPLVPTPIPACPLPVITSCFSTAGLPTPGTSGRASPALDSQFQPLASELVQSLITKEPTNLEPMDCNPVPSSPKHPNPDISMSVISAISSSSAMSIGSNISINESPKNVVNPDVSMNTVSTISPAITSIGSTISMTESLKNINTDVGIMSTNVLSIGGNNCISDTSKSCVNSDLSMNTPSAISMSVVPIENDSSMFDSNKSCATITNDSKLSDSTINISLIRDTAEEMQTDSMESSPNTEPAPSSSIGPTDSLSNNDTEQKQLLECDVKLLVDLFYLPFEHGNQGLSILQEFHWLKSHGHLICVNPRERKKPIASENSEIQEWHNRASKFDAMTQAVGKLLVKITFCPNRSLLYDLYPYVWDIKGVISMLNSYLKWIALRRAPMPVSNFISSPFSCYKEAFMSGDQEPWSFLGGLTSELQHLLPLESSNDLFLYKTPETPNNRIYTIRPYLPSDEAQVYDICRRTCDDGSDGSEVFPGLPNLIGDKLIGHFLCLSPDYCFVVEDDIGICGYALAALDARQLKRKYEICWVPELLRKYPAPSKKTNDILSPAEEIISGFYNPQKVGPPDIIYEHHPSILKMNILASVNDPSVPKRMLTCILSTLKANGSHGVFVEVTIGDKNIVEFFSKLGFMEISHPGLRSDDISYMGRTF